MSNHGRNDYAAQILLAHEATFGAAGRYNLGLALHGLADKNHPLPLPSTINTNAKTKAFLKWLRQDMHAVAAEGPLRLSMARIPNLNQHKTRERLVQIVRELEELQPLVLCCESNCAADQQQACLADSASAIGRTGAFPYPFASPAQSLIDDVSYWGSPRFTGDAARMLTKGSWVGCRL